MRSETVYLEDARETLPHSAIQVVGAILVGLPELPILEDTSHSGKRHATVSCLLLIDARRITGKSTQSSRPTTRRTRAVAAMADRPYECTVMPMSDVYELILGHRYNFGLTRAGWSGRHGCEELACAS